MCIIKQSKMNDSTHSLHPNEYSQEFHFYPFAVKLDRYVGSCNNFNDLSCNCKCKFDGRKCNSNQ